MNKIKMAICFLVLSSALLAGCKENSKDDIVTSNRFEGIVHHSIGGAEKEYETPYDTIYYGIPVFLRDIAGDEVVDKWLEQFESEKNPNGRSKWEITVVNAVNELGIPKEKFNEANNGLSYTKKQIEAIYSEDTKVINKEFVNKYALLINDEIFTASWLTEHTEEEWGKEGLTKEIIKEYLKTIKDTPLQEEYEKIKQKQEK